MSAAKIRTFMDRESLDQAALAKKAGVSQATVSRALGGAPQRRGKALRRLLAFVGATGGKRGPSLSAKRRVARAFEKIWDGSPEHAAVVARIIGDLEGLRPSPSLRRRLEQRKRT